MLMQSTKENGGVEVPSGGLVKSCCNATLYGGVGGDVGEVCHENQLSGSGARHSASEQGNERGGSEFVSAGGISNVMLN